MTFGEADEKSFMHKAGSDEATALHRLLELRGVPPHAEPVAVADPSLGGVRHAAGAVQSAGARARARPAVPRRGPGHPAVVAARRRLPHRQAAEYTTGERKLKVRPKGRCRAIGRATPGDHLHMYERLGAGHHASVPLGFGIAARSPRDHSSEVLIRPGIR